MQLARNYHCSDTHIGKKLVGTEGLFNGNLLALDIDLEMEG